MYKILFLVLMLISMPVMAFELDTSVDEEIRKNYNPSAIENSLPALPKTSPSEYKEPKAPPKSLPKSDKASQGVVKNFSYTQSDKSTAIKIKKGTKVKVKSNVYLSDSTRVGSTFKFTSLTPIYQRYITIPQGTTFDAVVLDSHTPQITGNGGLLEIAVTGVNFQGGKYYANGKVTKANHKKIFINNIKGKHQYWKGVSKQVNKGQNFYNKTRRFSGKLSNNPIGAIIAPIPTVFGSLVYVLNFVGSPIFAVGTKGGNLSIPAGSEFEIKLLEDAYLAQ